jgi:SAM-dependent methyltransferase
MTIRTHRRSSCRLCDSSDLHLALPLTPTPIGDHYIAESQRDMPQPVFPLDLHLCGDCGHVQLLEVVDPQSLFGDYTFVTASSPGLVDHFRRHADEVCRRFPPAGGSLVVEIGSNDGSLLRFYQERDCRVLGIDPARDVAARAAAAGVETLPTFFTSDLAREIRSKRGPAALIEANNVFAHADELRDIVRGVRTLLADDGVFVFEVSYLIDIVEKCLFDTVYHEHLSYHSVEPLARFFRSEGLELCDIERIGTKGGSLRGYVRHAAACAAPSPIVAELIALEQRAKIRELSTWQRYTAELAVAKQALHRELDRVQSEDTGPIAGFGASVTVTTLLYHFDLGRRLSMLLDDNPNKRGLLSPGYHLPVCSSAQLYEPNPPAAVVVLAWQYADMIMGKHARYIDAGGRFIVPLPTVRVLTRGG